MAQLFGTGTIKSHTEVLPGFDDSKISLIQKLHQDWKNGLLAGETEYEQTFNQLFFGELLGYEDRANRIPKGAVTGTGIADLTLGYFEDGKYDLDHVQVVCELKGAKTNLVKKQFGHGGLSPVGQGFSYKTGFKNCKRLLVSNFYEIRLYRDNQTDFEVRTLDELMDPKDNYFNLRKLYLLLHRNNLLTHIGKSRTEDLLSHFREEQKEITAKFYKEYKTLRVELINDMKQHNPGISSEILIEKAQKIIDRLIFIFFCEDKGLLPDKKLKENIVRSREAGFSAWEVTRKFFGLVDTGSEQLGIPDGYNGGLFQKDDTLDALGIGDEICKKFVNLTNYDFDDKLSVNVLGHIFEQSISDLENLKIDLLGQEVETYQLAETGKGRRKKDGIFYTPEYIVDYIVQNSVMKYLNEKEDECLSEVSTIDEKTGERRRKKNIDNAEQQAYLKYQQILQNIKVLDPACGSGAFLVRVFDVLLEENKRVGSILNSLFDETETYKNILTNNIYGVDLNEESVEITKLSLRLKSAQKGKKLNNLDGNIKCGNSLIDDVFVAKEKAFDWDMEFKEIMKSGGFDVIVGNPPYVRSRELFSEEEKKYFLKKYETCSYQLDLYKLFIERSLVLVKKSGLLAMITPSVFLINDYDVPIRKHILEGFDLEQICSFTKDVFEDATVKTVVFIIRNSISKDHNIIFEILDAGNSQKKWNISQSSLKNGGYLINEKTDSNNQKMIQKLSKFDKIGKYFDIKNGIKVRKDLLFDKPLDANYKPFLLGESVKPYFIGFENIYVHYLLENEKLFTNQAFRNKDIFEREKLLVRQILGKKKIYSCYDDKSFYADQKIYIVLKKEKLELKYLNCIISSKLCYFYYANTFFDNKVVFPQIKGSQIAELPIPEISLSDQQPFIEKADKMLTLNKDLHELTDKFLHRIQDNLKIEKLTKKLENFYEGDFKDFLAELKKQKVSLSLSQQDEREPYFKEYKEKILALKGEIGRVDGEIDAMVYRLYGLTEEEVKVVEGK